MKIPVWGECVFCGKVALGYYKGRPGHWKCSSLQCHKWYFEASDETVVEGLLEGREDDEREQSLLHATSGEAELQG